MIENFIGKLDEQEYRARQRGADGGAPAIGGSGLVTIERLSAAHHVANQAKMRESTVGAHGTLIHCLLLEPETFARRYYVRPDVVERFDAPEPYKVDAPAGAEPYKVSAPALVKRDALEVVLLEGYAVEKDEDGAWTFDEASVGAIGNDALDALAVLAESVEVSWPTRREATEAAAALDPWAFSDYADATLRFPNKEAADFAAKRIDGGRWIVAGAAAHWCEACGGTGASDTDSDSCWRCYDTGAALGFATQADAKAHAATVSGWTLNGVEFYKHKKDVPVVVADGPSGWTGDGVDFYPAKKALLEESDVCSRWALAGSVETGPFFRTRELASEHAKAEAGDRIPITLADYARATDAADAVTAHEVAGQLLNAADATELSVLWHDKANGADCSGQLDAYLANTDGVDLPGLCIEPGKRIGVDLKTTSKLLAPGTEARTILDGGHHIQGAHYMNGCAANGKPLDAWIMIYVETHAPYGVRVVRLGETFLALGRYRRERALARVREWLALGAEALPPSYVETCTTVEPPAHAVPDAVDEASWSDWVSASKVDAHAVIVAALEVEHGDAAGDVGRIEAALAAVFAGKSELARKAVAHASAGDYGAALAVSDGIPSVDDEIAALRLEHAAAEIHLAKSYAALQEARNV